jgi:hypothetical protein
MRFLESFEGRIAKAIPAFGPRALSVSSNVLRAIGGLVLCKTHNEDYLPTYLGRTYLGLFGGFDA